MATTTVEGRRVRYELTGDGPRTAVWTHGVGASLDYWRDYLPHFQGLRHLTYDVRGMGESEGTDGPVSLSDWARDLAGLMDALEVERAIIAGHSMGGAISQRFAIDFPERTEGLFLMATSSRVGAAATANWLKRADVTEATNPRLAAAQRAVAAYNMDEGLKTVRVPSLIIVGDADPQTPPGGSVIMSRLIPGAELEIYPGIGHSPMHEEPAAVARVEAWLSRFR
ncbi:MAG: alpha/beta hydrolase [Dehalococcoidia bacterium]|nr:alpha/beta hydrolase [Dehalococcoidia bacterium]